MCQQGFQSADLPIRCGVEHDSDALTILAEEIVKSRCLRFHGLQCYNVTLHYFQTQQKSYQGAIQHVRAYQDRKNAVKPCVEKAKLAKSRIEALGISCSIITGEVTCSESAI